MSSVGYPDYQRITQWLGAPLAQQTAFVIGAGNKVEGPLELANYASVVVAVKPTGGKVTVTIAQAVQGGPPGLVDTVTFSVADGATAFEAIVLLGAAVTITFQGAAVGQTVDYAIYGANTTTQVSQVSGGATPTGTILAFAGAVAPSGYALCDGSLYDGTTAQYAALWGVIGNVYGGPNQASFAVPDLRGRVPVGQGTNAAVNARGLSDGVAVANRRPQHRHSPHVHSAVAQFMVLGAPNVVYAGGGNGNFVANTNGADGGSGVATDSLDAPAFLVLNYIIAL